MLKQLLTLMLIGGVIGFIMSLLGAPIWLTIFVAWSVGMLQWYPRPPDFLIGGAVNPYMRRWWVIPRNRFFNIYLHHFLRSDDDRALHDHPWWNMSVLLKGNYIEHVPADPKAWKDSGDRRTIVHERKRGFIYTRPAQAIHRVELYLDVHEEREIPCWTLFITGPKLRDWGFWCKQGFKPWWEYTKGAGSTGEIGKGCGE